MKKTLLTFTLLSIASAFALAAVPQDAPLIKANFETDVAGWTAMGTNATAGLTSDAGVAKEGKQALKYTYNLAKGETSFLALPELKGKLKGAKAVTFWAKGSENGSLMMMLQEQGGGRYSAAFRVPKDQWQRVEISVDDFSLTEGADDPKDANRKLDLDLVESIVISDFGQFLVQIDNADLAKLLNIQSGKRELYMDDFAVTTTAAIPAFTAKAGEVEVDTFSSPQVDLVAVGRTSLAYANGGPLGAKSLMVTYRQSPMGVMGFGKGFTGGVLTGMTRMVMKAASTKPMQFQVQLEEVGGGKWNGTIELPGVMQAKDINLKFEDFSEADDSKDSNKKLDLDKVNRIFFIDLTGLVTQVDQENTLWISGLKVLAK